MTADRILQEAVAITGWDDESQISVLCDFIDQMNKVQPDFETYINQRVDEEEDLQ